MKNQEELHATQSLYEAAYLMSKKFDLSGKHQDGNKVVLGFSGKGVKQASLDFYNGGEVSAREYSDNYRTLKDYVFQR